MSGEVMMRFSQSGDPEAYLSLNQERWWFLQQLQLQSPAYNLPISMKLKGRLEVEALRQALKVMVRQHTILQSVFPFVNGRVEVRAMGDAGLELSLKDFSQVPPERRMAQAAEWLAAVARHPFDLAKGPLVRTALACLKDDEHLLLLVLHRIIGDASSAKLLAREMISGYTAAVRGQPAPVGATTWQYEDFICWQRQELSQRLQEGIAFWKHLLNDASILEIPADRPRPPIQTSNGAVQEMRLPGDLAKELQELSHQKSTGLSLILLAALQILLHRYTQQADIVVGCAVNGRHRPETLSLIGCCDNILVCRTQVQSEASFDQMLAQLRTAWQEAMANQDIPFAKVVKEIITSRDMSRTPFFQVFFDFDEPPWEGQQTDGLTIEPWFFDPGIATYDLTLKVLPDRGGLECLFIFNTDLFEGATIGRMAGHYQTLLQGLVANPGEPIFRLPLLTAPERQQILVEWNDTATAYPKDRCMHELFADWALHRPEAEALSFAGRVLTYRELDIRSNRWAHYLRRLGVGPDTPVGICMESSVEMLVGMLGILKAGGCYVPLDVEYPAERIAFMLADTQAKMLLTQPHLLMGFGENLEALTLCVDPDDTEVAAESPQSPENIARPDNLACIFYTSGSTGKPKGVPVLHYAVNRLVRDTNYINFQPDDRVAQASNISFDGASFEIWGALLNGGCLVGCPKEILLSAGDFAIYLRDQKINVLFLTPALFYQIAREAPTAFRSVRDLVMGGEILEPRWVREVMRQAPPARLINGYGPTESTTFATWYQVAEIPEENRAIPIGRPISNTEVYILDRNLQPVPIGIPGELCIGGDGLARSYLNRPEETTEKFIPHPFREDSQARLYKTGDLARFLPDGNIDFLGRMDHQLKIRGFRIEPGEIETLLSSHPGVQQALVLAWEDEPGEKWLVAYIQPFRHFYLSPEILRDFLRGLLPLYMIPTYYLFLENFPLTPNGKINRAALPVPDRSHGLSEKIYMRSRNELEERLVELWEAVLGVRPIGVHDNFFSLGGHSILAARLTAHMEKIFRIKLPLSLIYERPTVAQMAEAIKGKGVSANSITSLMMPIYPQGTRPPFFLIQGLDSLPHLRGALGEEQPLYGLRSPFTLIDQKLLTSGVQGLAAHYLQAVRLIQSQGPYFFGGFSVGGVLAYEMARQVCQEGGEVALLFLLDPTPVGPEAVFRVPLATFLERLGALNIQGKVSYLYTNLKDRFKKLAYRALRKAGLPLPFGLTQLAFDEAVFAALRDYKPPTLSVRALILESLKPPEACPYRWSELLSGPSEVQTIEADHMDICKLPHILAWVELLRQALLEAQEITGSKVN